MEPLDPREKWNQRHALVQQPRPAARVLSDNLHLLPRQGEALDLACGLGANALVLAELGLHTTAWDISDLAIARLRQEAQRRHLPINAEIRDVLAEPPPPGAYDVILVTHFLARDLIPHLIAALRPGGLVFYQTFTLSRLTERGPTNPEMRLAENELLRLFAGLHLRYYREDDSYGDPAAGLRDLAALVAQRQD